MKPRRTLTMNWDGLGDDDDDDHFFESFNRLSTAAPNDLASSSDEDEDFDDHRISFASAISSIHSHKNRAFSQTGAVAVAAAATDAAPGPDYDYGIWMAAPASITERRKRLLHGMGLDENKQVLRFTSSEFVQAISNKLENDPPYSEMAPFAADSAAPPVNATSSLSLEQKTERRPVPFDVVRRSRSEGDIDSSSMEKFRKEELIGKGSKQRLTRTATEIAMPRAQTIPNNDRIRATMKDAGEAGHSNRHSRKFSSSVSDSGLGAFFLIKNLDTGKEFIVNGYDENGTWNRLSDLQTGKQLTMEEFEKTVGYSPVVNEVMRRANVTRNQGYSRKISSSSYISRSLRMSKRRGAALLKNIKGVASGFKGEREREVTPTMQVHQHQQQQMMETTKPTKNQWVKVRQSGKSHKELSALHLCQEFQAHEGCIWTIKFSLDGHFLASAGEDKVIHVWEVQECEVMSLRPEEGNLTPIHPSLLASSTERNGLTESPSLSFEKKKKSRFGSRRGSMIPEYVHVPETVFSLSEKPYCSFQGHLDDVLDLSWSKSLLLLSSSMDKTVRLWDLETKACLKLFAHNDYVTCIQFNPIDDHYFISGSLDAKVRIWSIPERHVVDWTDIHEMVTAVSYTPDAHGALVGTHKGFCRTYSIQGCKLTQTGTIEVRHKKKSHLRKVTGFQFAPGNPSQVLVTSADSRIRILEGSEIVHKFKGFRNANSQIAGSFSPDGRYIISASEDSQVYVWKHEEPRNHAGFGKGRSILVTRSHEHFQCRDVSVAIPWPHTIKGDPPSVPLHHSKRHSKRFATSSQAPYNYGEDSITKRMRPPLPKKGSNIHAMEGASNSPKELDPAAISRTESGIGDSFGNSSKRFLPHFHKKSSNHYTSESVSTPTDEELEAISRIDLGNGDSFASGSASARFCDSPSISVATTPSSVSLSFSSFSSFDGGHGSPATIHPSAWGLVIVTAGFGGEIRCYQNFGLPKRMSRLGGPT